MKEKLQGTKEKKKFKKSGNRGRYNYLKIDLKGRKLLKRKKNNKSEKDRNKGREILQRRGL